MTRRGRTADSRLFVARVDDGRAAIVGCAPQAATITLGLRLRGQLARVKGSTDRSIDELLAAGAAMGEDARVAEANAIIRADGACRLSRSATGATHSPKGWSDGDDLEEIVEAEEICGVARVQAGLVGVRCCGNQQVEGSRPRLTPGASHCSGETSVARGDRVIDGQRIKAALQHGQSPQPFCSGCVVSGHHDTEVQLGE